MLDMTDSIAPRSDQMNADDLMSGPRTFTITEVRRAESPDQPIEVFLAEFPADRPFKPSKSMRRVMVVAWGRDATGYVGRRLTLFRDPDVKFGRDEVGGIRISHMSHIDKPLKLALTVTRGKRAPFVVKQLTEAAPASTPLAELGRAMTGAGIVDVLGFLSGALGRKITGAKDVTEAEAVALLKDLKESGEAAPAQ